jgi:hypothetical protein
MFLGFFWPPFLLLVPAASTFSDRRPFLGPAASGGRKKREIKKASAAFRKAAEVQPVLAEYNRLTNTAVNINELLADDQ